MGRYRALMFTIGVTGTPRFCLSLMNNLKVITNFDFATLTPCEQEVVQELSNFKFISSRTLITRGRGDDSMINEYLGELGKNLRLKLL